MLQRSHVSCTEFAPNIRPRVDLCWLLRSHWTMATLGSVLRHLTPASCQPYHVVGAGERIGGAAVVFMVGQKVAKTSKVGVTSWALSENRAPSAPIIVAFQETASALNPRRCQEKCRNVPQVRSRASNKDRSIDRHTFLLACRRRASDRSMNIVHPAVPQRCIRKPGMLP
jgi:hypothetical protein